MKTSSTRVHGRRRQRRMMLGLFATLALTSACTSVTAPVLRVGPRTYTHEDTGAADPTLASMLQRVSRGLQQVGLREGSGSLAGFLLGGNHATLAVEIPAGQCVTLIALVTNNVHDIDAALYTPEGELLTVDSEPNAHPTIQACARDAARKLYYVIQLYDGDGSFLVVPFYGARTSLAAAAHLLGVRPAFAEARSGDLRDDPAASLAEGLRKRGYAPMQEPLVFPIAERERVRTNLPVEVGKCYTIAAFGGEGVVDLALRVVDDQGHELGAGDDGSAQAAMQLCAHTSASYVVESEAQTGQGDITLVVYRADVVVAGGEAGLWLGRRASLPTADGVRGSKD